MTDLLPAILPFAVLTALLALVPVWDALAVRLARHLNVDWAEGSVHWAEEAGVSEPTLAELRVTPPVAVPDAPRTSVWALGGGIAALSAAWVWLHPGDLPGAVTAMILGATLLVAVLVDLRVQLLPDMLVWPLAALGAGMSVLGWGIAPHTALIGALAGGLSLWALSMLFLLMRGQAGLGLGDVKLVAMAGLWVGWMPLPWLLLGASIVAILLHLALYAGPGGKRIPFGPALACAFLAIRLLPL